MAKTVQDGAITTGKIAVSSIVTSNLADNSVTSSKIAEGAITSAKIAAESWSTWIPTISNTPEFTVTSILRSRYIRLGNVVHFDLSINGNLNGTMFVLPVSLPVPMRTGPWGGGGYGAFIINGHGSGISGTVFIINENTIGFKQYNGAAIEPGNNLIFSCSGTYEAAN